MSNAAWTGGDPQVLPFLSPEMLIKSRTTYREQDRADLVWLRGLLELKRQRGDAAN